MPFFTMKNYIKNIVYNVLSILDGAINLVWSIMGSKRSISDLSSNFVMSYELVRMDTDIRARENYKEDKANSVIEELKSDMESNNVSQEDINEALADLDNNESGDIVVTTSLDHLKYK